MCRLNSDLIYVVLTFAESNNLQFMLKYISSPHHRAELLARYNAANHLTKRVCTVKSYSTFNKGWFNGYLGIMGVGPRTRNREICSLSENVRIDFTWRGVPNKKHDGAIIFEYLHFDGISYLPPRKIMKHLIDTNSTMIDLQRMATILARNYMRKNRETKWKLKHPNFEMRNGGNKYTICLNSAGKIVLTDQKHTIYKPCKRLTARRFYSLYELSINDLMLCTDALPNLVRDSYVDFT
jgi:hypothetical protein